MVNLLEKCGRAFVFGRIFAFFGRAMCRTPVFGKMDLKKRSFLNCSVKKPSFRAKIRKTGVLVLDCCLFAATLSQRQVNNEAKS